MLNISSESFYGSSSSERNLETPRKVDPRIGLQKRQTPLLSPSRTWLVFERQDEALACANERGNGLMTFVFHAAGTGQRTFLVAHPREFWLLDVKKEKKDRNSYEIIPEFVQCKLYLDLEFDKEYNPNHNGIIMTELIIKIIAFKLLKLYHLKIDRSNILDLDSTTDKKFSRHLIYQIPFLSFANNYQVGIFMREICALIRVCDENLCQDLQISVEDLKQLMVKDRHGKEKTFCDEGVYTKNRHFRIYGSTKPHKNSHLVISEENLYTLHLDDEVLKEEAIFLASLITNFEPLDIVVPLPELKNSKSIKSYRNPTSNTGNSNTLPSPFPILDTFAMNIMQHEGIRCWIYFPSTQCLVYEGQRQSFCGNIGREHRSNKGMLVIDLRHSHYYRKCHDPDCAGYQSEPSALPSYVLVSLQNPQCSEEQRQEIQQLFEFLESRDESILVDNEEEAMTCDDVVNTSNVDITDLLNFSDLSVTTEDVSQHDMSVNSESGVTEATSMDVYESEEVKDILQFLHSQPDLDEF